MVICREFAIGAAISYYGTFKIQVAIQNMTKYLHRVANLICDGEKMRMTEKINSWAELHFVLAAFRALSGYPKTKGQGAELGFSPNH